MNHNWYAVCAGCRAYDLKRNMRSIKVGAYNPVQLCWLCEGCFCRLLDRLEVSM